MKKQLMASALLLLAGCTSAVDDMINNQFASIQAETPPAEIQGTWTGSVGPYLVTMQMDESGFGKYCYSYGSSDILEKVKYNSNVIYYQNGTKTKVSASPNGSLQVTSDYYSGSTSTLFPDKKLSNSSLFCSEKLK